ncbi:preprotein translocase subunit Sec61beta [Candidatus Nanohalococcus occultus]|uniref:Preprotein translocase subunit Sec61beta n=1 Tax=Candidatus Nanohalococcus occultus TaxID=2978047 RepID=A0ABY8CFF0_9ARCH|nr:Preprotein translocase subunit Sec61beta [Candidatus Nanohaloarchaeota archaeon SVXNc]
MAKQEQSTLPSGQGGLVQYFDSDTGFDLNPKTVVGICGAVAVIELALHTGLFA